MNWAAEGRRPMGGSMKSWRRGLGVGALLSVALVFGCRDGADGSDGPEGGSSTGGARNAVCAQGSSGGEVQAPVFLTNLRGQTGWYASPVIADLDGDGANELIAAYYSVYVFDDQGNLLADSADGDGGRVYAPHVVVDLEGDGSREIIVGRGRNVVAYSWSGSSSGLERRWVTDTTTANNAPEVRGLAAADLDGDGWIEIVATTTQTASTEEGGAQVFVFDVDGRPYQPRGGHQPAWPRYNNRSGHGNDADRNLQGHRGYGCYGLNVAIGEIDGDPELEIIATYDNHHIQAFDHDGIAIDAAPWFTNRRSEFGGERLTWGQFIRWADPTVEREHYHDHVGDWPHPSWAEWLQWTASPPNVVDLDGDGDNEVVGVPNVEMHEPYETQAYAVMVLEGSHGDGSRSAMRLPGWEELPRGDRPILVDGWYPPLGVPAAATVNLQGDARPEILVSLNDGFLYAFDAEARVLWRFNYTHGHSVMYASEPVVADLNQDGSPEVLFSTYGAPDVTDSGNLVVLAADGELLHDIALPNPGSNGNGNGAPAAPTVGDLDGDGELEILVQTFDHGMDVFTVPGSGTACLPWPTSRGGPLRMGQPNGS